MAISDKLMQLQTIKSDIKSAISGKGQTVSENMTTYASAISKIAPILQSKNVTPAASQQTISPDIGFDGLSKVVVPPTIGVTPIFSTINVSVGSTQTYSIETTIDLPIDTERDYSQMSTVFLVVISDDDMLEWVCYPFSVVTAEESLGDTTVYPTNGYPKIAVPSTSANYDSFETEVSLNVVSYAGASGSNAATIEITIATESTSAEYNCTVYRIDRTTY